MRRAATASVVAATLALLVACSEAGSGGSFTPAEHGDGVPLDSPSIVSWATALGPGGYNPGLEATSFMDESLAFGPVSGISTDVVVLGRGGSITVEFGLTFADGRGADIAVWENGFIDTRTNLLFAELAFVEVSSDGVNFVRFSTSTTQSGPVGDGGLDPSLYTGFAGLHPAGTGTAFDLSQLASDPQVTSGAVDLAAIRYVRIVDIVGDGGTFDDEGNAIYDPYPTAGTAGFDLDGVAILRSP